MRRLQHRKVIFWVEGIFFLVFLLFPLRHATWGLDLSDTGYNYGNFRYNGMDQLSSMWFFATYFTNVVGHFLTLLPGGKTLVGMNLYTGLIVTLLCSLGYWFCTRKLGMRRSTAFLGELLAMCMCWCPTAKLYDYFTYLLFLGCFLFLYTGLTEENNRCLVLAGICLGINVFVRFSNVPQAGLILAVWVYHALRRIQTGKKSRGLQDTLWCMAGYFGGFFAILGWICIKYGLGAYVNGITSLFAMTEEATDYKAISMIMGLLNPYRESIYWIARMMVFVLASFITCLCTGAISRILQRRGRNEKVCKGILWAGRGIGMLLVGAMVWWMYKRGFATVQFFSYNSIYWPGTIFLVFAMGMAGIEILLPKSSLSEKLLGGMLILTLLFSSLGSNNGIYPSMNNLFLAAPYVLREAIRFGLWTWKTANEEAKNNKFNLDLITVSGAVWAVIAVCMIQFAGFGFRFTYCEGTGVYEIGYQVQSIPSLQGVTMNQERARQMEELGAYVRQQGLSGKEVLLHGGVPSLSFYLEMPPALHTWNDLTSYRATAMEEDMKRVREEILELGAAKPVVITSKAYGGLGPDREGVLYEDPEAEEKVITDEKWSYILEFMDEFGYRRTFENDKFVVWESLEN